MRENISVVYAAERPQEDAISAARDAREEETLVEALAKAEPLARTPAWGKVVDGSADPPAAEPPRANEHAFFLVRAAATPLARLLFRARLRGAENVPSRGPALGIMGPHPSYADPVLLMTATLRPFYFLVFRFFTDLPILGRLLKEMGGIPIASKALGGTSEAIRRSIAAARRVLARGEAVGLSPEGLMSYNGNMHPLRPGFLHIEEGFAAPIVPVHIDNMGTSIFSHRRPPWRLWLKNLFEPVIVRVGKPLREASIQAAREAFQELGALSMAERARGRGTLPRAFLRGAKWFWGRRAVAGSEGRSLTYGRLLTEAALLARAWSGRLGSEARVELSVPPSVEGALANLALAFLGKTAVNRDEGGLGVSDVEDALAGVSRWRRLWTRLALRWLPSGLLERLFFPKIPRGVGAAAAEAEGVTLSHLNLQAASAMLAEQRRPEDASRQSGVPFSRAKGLVALWSALLQGDFIALGGSWAPVEGEYAPAELSGVGARNIPDVTLFDHTQVGTKPGTVGQPLPGSAMKVVDPVTFEPVPDGQSGLLVVFGPHVAKGRSNNGWYVTGRKAVMDPEGFVTLLP